MFIIYMMCSLKIYFVFACSYLHLYFNSIKQQKKTLQGRKVRLFLARVTDPSESIQGACNCLQVKLQQFYVCSI